ncbi:MAG: hypothetical protein HFACDABA_00492 [Anaerolineales bacterium]|nr:hypothetical protein [Anaerolineales bacterium]
MKALLDTNVFLEIILSQERANDAKELLLKAGRNEFFITDYSLHSIGLLLFRKKQHEAFRAFIEDVLVNGGIGLLYAVAERYDLVLVSFDTDFQRTDRGHKLPSEVT